MVQKEKSYLSLWLFTHGLFPAHAESQELLLTVKQCVVSDANGYQEQLEENCQDDTPL